MSEHDDVSRPMLVACLCAAWCRTCDDYRPVFDALALEFSEGAHFVWVDIEDDEAALDGVDVVDFPTLLISRGETIAYYGPVLPHLLTARQLIQRARESTLGEVKDAALVGLPGRLFVLR